MSGIVFIISAPSGSGKSTLTAELLRSVPGLEFSISYTTRRPRGSEQDAREYHFVDVNEFKKMLAAGEFLEHACVFGDYYGTARRYLREAADRGHDLVLDIDVQGAAQVKQKLPDAVSIFILPPSRQELESRLRRRSESEKQLEDAARRLSDGEREATIQRRLQAAAREIENYCEYDYILVNDQLERSIDRLKAVVLAERLKRSGKTLSPADQQIVELAHNCLLPNVRGQVQQILDSFTASRA
ncbi:MAG: guanylate kinase [Terriglobales bacterium]